MVEVCAAQLGDVPVGTDSLCAGSLTISTLPVQKWDCLPRQAQNHRCTATVASHCPDTFQIQLQQKCFRSLCKMCSRWSRKERLHSAWYTCPGVSGQGWGIIQTRVWPCPGASCPGANFFIAARFLPESCKQACPCKTWLLVKTALA